MLKFCVFCLKTGQSKSEKSHDSFIRMSRLFNRLINRYLIFDYNGILVKAASYNNLAALLVTKKRVCG